MFTSRFIYVVYINVGSEKNFFGGKQLTVLPPWLHSVCDVAKAGLLWSVNLPRLKNEVN